MSPLHSAMESRSSTQESPHRLLQPLADDFMQSSYKKPMITCPTSQINSSRSNADLAMLLNKDTLEPNLAVFAFNEASTSKKTWGMVILIVRGFLRRPSLSGTPTVTFCPVHIHNVVAKKRGYMHQHNVDFIGGDFNMSAFSTVGDVFSDPEFAASAARSCGVSADWTTHVLNARGSSSCPSAHMTGESTLTAATSTTMPSLALDPVTKQLTLLFSSISAPPAYLAPTASRAVNTRSKDGLSGAHIQQTGAKDETTWMIAMLFIKIT